MKNKLIYYFNKFDNWKYTSLLLIILAIAIKIVYLILVTLIDNNNISGHFYNNIQGDNVIYKSFCENLFQRGEYATTTGNSIDYTFRMPGLAFVYVPIRLFVNSYSTIDVVIVIQTILSGLAAYALALLSRNIFQKKMIFYIVYIITCFGFLIPLYNNMFMTESLALSSMIFGVYFFHRAIIEGNNKFYFMSGLFMTWMVFLRPFMLVFFIMIILFLVYLFLQRKIYMKVIFIFISSFLIIDGAWTFRNYMKLNKFMPLQSSSSWAGSCPESYKLRLKFEQDFGFKGEPWAFESQSGWFEDTIKHYDKKYLYKIFPSRTFNGDLTLDSLIKLKEFCQLTWSTQKTTEERIDFDNKAIRLLNKFTLELINNRPVDYYLLNRIRIINNFLSENLYCGLVPLKYPFNVIGVFGDSFSNYFLKFFGFIGLFLILFKYRKNYLILLLVLSVPFFIMFYFPIYSRLDESRFFVMAIPFLMISAGYLLSLLLEMKKFVMILLLLIVPCYLSFQVLIDKVNF